MSAAERSVFDVFEDIANNIEDIFRSEIRLAKTQIREEIATSKSSVSLVGLGILSAIFAVFFALVAIVCALSYVLPNWAAALLVALGLAACAGIVISAGLRRFKRINSVPKTTGSLKENDQWARRQTR
jgi:uncharacterized membrane protein YqjE